MNGVCLTAVGAGRRQLRGRPQPRDAARAARSATLAAGRSASTSSSRCAPPTGSAATSCRATSTASATVDVGRATTGARARCASTRPPELLRYVVEKGSIAVDGVSLTVTARRRRRLLGLPDPRDARRAPLSAGAEPGRPVNLEVDVIAKHVEKLVATSAMSEQPRIRTIEEALEDIRAGKMVVVCDAEDRENEGDLTLAAQFATPENINFMAREARGLICLALTAERCDELGLDLMAAKNESAFETAFTVSVEAREGVTTGISAHDRAHTIQVAIDPRSQPARPGAAGPRVPAEGTVRRRARAHRADRGGRRPRAARRA